MPCRAVRRVQSLKFLVKDLRGLNVGIELVDLGKPGQVKPLYTFLEKKGIEWAAVDGDSRLTDGKGKHGKDDPKGLGKGKFAGKTSGANVVTGKQDDPNAKVKLTNKQKAQIVCKFFNTRGLRGIS